jgi:hypothetical protein
MASPVLSVVAGAVESVWVTVSEGETEGVAISDTPAPAPPPDAFEVLIAEPPTRSVRRDDSLPELTDVVAIGVDEPVGLHLTINRPTAAIGDFKFEGPVKPLIDALAPLLGGVQGRPHDHRVRDLRVVRGSGSDGSATVAVWLLASPMGDPK